MLDPRYKIRVIRLRNVPDTPANFAGADAANERDVDLSWDAPPNVVVDNYTIEHTFIDIDGTEVALATIIVDGDQTTRTVACWQDTHKFRITANNAEGSSTPSSWVSVAVAGGYTDFALDGSAHIVYVSQDGNDLNDGLSRAEPKLTISGGLGAVRDGYGDWLLLRCGDTWTSEVVGQLTKSGLSATYPLLISAYSEGSTSRPIVKTGLSSFMTTQNGLSETTTLDYVAVVGIEAYPHTYAGGATNPTGIQWIMPGTYLRIEDCYFHHYGSNLSIVGYANVGGDNLYDLFIRRNIITDSYSIDEHTQGLFLGYSTDVLIEENVFDHNGWNESVSGAEATAYDRNMYLNKTNTNVTTRGNVSARSSSEGLQQRSGGAVDNNLFLQNSQGILFGHFESVWPDYSPGGTITNNVILDARDIDGSNPRGGGIGLQNVDTVEVTGNIIAHQDSGTSNVIAIQISYNFVDLNIHDNIVYDWTRPGGGSEVMRFTSTSGGPGGTHAITANDFQQPVDGYCINTDTFSGFTYTGNRYYSPDSNEFKISGVNKTYAQWVTASSETGSSNTAITYTDASRDITTYMASIGGTETLVGFLTGARALSRKSWDVRYTADPVNDYIRAGFVEA